ncbi:YesL family protein [Bacillus salitolerans]|uniref:YesL family protein n=1 Tax=Bacillus salitolerans TaxID=1437434 RepID=A0ABW4LRS3_9BACI
MHAHGFMGLFYGLTEWIMKLSVINILWSIINIPIFLILLLMALSPSNSAVAFLAIPFAFLLPLLFFPSTTAVFGMVRDWLLKKENGSLVKGYWLHLKNNYKPSSLSGVILTFIWFVWGIDYFYLRSFHDILGIVLFFIGILLFAFTMIFFCLYVHYHMGMKELFKHTFFVTVGSPYTLLGTLIMNSIVIFLSTRFLFLIPFFTMSICAFLTFYLFYRFSLRVTNKET